MGRREEFYVLNVGANISRQGLRVWGGQKGKGGGWAGEVLGMYWALLLGS